MSKIDMSPQAVTNRLRRVDELRDLCRTLAGPRLKYPQHPHVRNRAVRENTSIGFQHESFIENGQ